MMHEIYDAWDCDAWDWWCKVLGSLLLYTLKILYIYIYIWQYVLIAFVNVIYNIINYLCYCHSVILFTWLPWCHLNYWQNYNAILRLLIKWSFNVMPFKLSIKSYCYLSGNLNNVTIIIAAPSCLWLDDRSGLWLINS